MKSKVLEQKTKEAANANLNNSNLNGSQFAEPVKLTGRSFGDSGTQCHDNHHSNNKTERKIRNKIVKPFCTFQCFLEADENFSEPGNAFSL